MNVFLSIFSKFSSSRGNLNERLHYRRNLSFSLTALSNCNNNYVISGKG